MTRRAAAVLAWSLWGLSAVFAACFLALVAPGVEAWMVDSLLVAGLWFASATVGAVLASRRPDNPLGWLFVAVGLGLAFQGAALLYGYRGVEQGWALPLASGLVQIAYAVAAATWGVLITFTLLLFPTGSPPSPRWRWLVWAAALGNVAMTAGLGLFALRAGAGSVLDIMIRSSEPATVGIERILNNAGHVLVFLALIGGVTALAVRLRRARGEERQQMKWFAFAAGLTAVGILVGGFFLPDPYGVALELIALTALPISVGIAVLRYGLYEIDRIISRTVGYTLLSGVLAAVYVAAVLVLSRLLAPLGAGSELAVAAGTLTAAALFTPARRSIQNVVDRRFNRARYDAERTVQVFRTRLQDELDPDSLETELVAVIGDTFVPHQVGVWIRSEAGDRA